MGFSRIGWLETPDGPLAYRKAGSGPPLLLLHGWGGSSRYWLGAWPALGQHYTIYALDLPGFGESPAGPAASLGSLTQSVLHGVESLGLGSFVLAGHSLGAAVAILVAAQLPEQVSRLALVSFGLPRSPAEAALFAAMSAQMRFMAALWTPWLTLWRPWLLATRTWRQLAWTTPPLPAMLGSTVLAQTPHPAALALGICDFAGMDAATAVESAAHSGDLGVVGVASRLEVPTLVISGRADPLFPASSVATLASMLPRAHLHLIDDCGHVPMVETPAEFYLGLARFLSVA